MKITNLVERLRGPEDRFIRKAIMNRVHRQLTISPKGLAFIGGRRYTNGEATCVGRREAEAAFLGDFLPGVMQVFDEYFRRLEIKLGPSELEGVWAHRIRPCFNGMLQTLIDGVNADFQGERPSFVQSQIQELEKQANRVLKMRVE